MDLKALKTAPHRRFNPLSGEWILVSPQRALRPWQGQVEKSERVAAPRHDPGCYLCPGNPRIGGEPNPKYESTYVFDNDFAALTPESVGEAVDFEGKGLLVAEPEPGLCRVLCFSPRHDLTLAMMEPAGIRQVVDVWAEQYTEIGARPEIGYVQIFENRGAMMGCSNPHPHGQIWASRSLPNIVATEQANLLGYKAKHGCCMLCDYVAMELKERERIVVENEHFIAVVPFWATWPFETLLLSKQHATDVASLSAAQRDSLADALKRLTTRYDNLFEINFPYSAGMHQRPTDGSAHEEWHFHMHFLPPLLRSATVRKFMVGYELLASPQRDITPETAAERLRSLGERHFTENQ